MSDPSRPSDNSSLLGSVVPSQKYPGGRSIVLSDTPNREAAKLIDTVVSRDWEYVTVARPIDMVEKMYEVPTQRRVKTLIPKVQVREVVRTIPKTEPQWQEKRVDVPHHKIVDKYVEVPVVAGAEVKYVPKVEVRERVIETSKPEIKWVEKVIEVPRVLEAVRYIESEKNTETVIRYVPKGYKEGERGAGVGISGVDTSYQEGAARLVSASWPQNSGDDDQGQSIRSLAQYSEDDARAGILTPRGTVPLSGREGTLPPSPRLEKTAHLFIPRVSKTVEVQKDVPVTVDVPVPFMVPKPVQVPVDVPVMRFRDHFVPVPVRRHVIPQIKFTDETYAVECVKEKPLLVIEDYLKPVPIDVKIKLKEKDIKIIPIDPAELSQSDFHAMWMRVNADLLDRARAGRNPEVEKAFAKQVNGDLTTGDAEDFAEIEGESEEAREARRQQRREERLRARASEESIKDPDYGPLPLHPGHPLMMSHLQNQWIQNPSTVTHNMYTPDLFRLHASALDSLLHPQPHQVNITQQQSIQLGPLPSEAMPSPWNEFNIDLTKLTREKNSEAAAVIPVEHEEESEIADDPDAYVRRPICSCGSPCYSGTPCCSGSCSACCR